MRTLGAVLESGESGTVTITCGFDEGLTQQHGLFHGGGGASLVDVAWLGALTPAAQGAPGGNSNLKVKEKVDPSPGTLATCTALP